MVTDFGSRRDAPMEGLSRCLVEGDETAVASSRRARRKALLASLSLQIGLLAALVLVPLLAIPARPGPRLLRLTPIPPYPGSPSPNPNVAPTRPSTGGPPQGKTYWPTWISQPPRISHGVQRADGAEERPSGEVAEVGPGVPGGVWPVGTTGFLPGLVRPPIIVDAFSPEKRLKRSEGSRRCLFTASILNIPRLQGRLTCKAQCNYAPSSREMARCT